MNKQNERRPKDRSKQKSDRNSGRGGKKPKGIEAKPRPRTTETARAASRGEAIRAQKRSVEDAARSISQYLTNGDERQKRANFIDNTPRLKIIGLGGMDSGGSKNMILLEYLNDAIVLDC